MERKTFLNQIKRFSKKNLFNETKIWFIFFEENHFLERLKMYPEVDLSRGFVDVRYLKRNILSSLPKLNQLTFCIHSYRIFPNEEDQSILERLEEILSIDSNNNSHLSVFQSKHAQKRDPVLVFPVSYDQYESSGWARLGGTRRGPAHPKLCYL